MNTILFVITEQIKNISILLSPIIPLATKKILDNLNILLKDRTIDSINQPSTLNHDKPLKDPEILFSKIEDDS
jgi:methionyl-tRNA synthetase